MGSNGADPPPSQARSQPSIRSFFQPRTPTSTAPQAPPLPTTRTPTTLPIPPRPTTTYALPPSHTPPPKPQSNATLPPQAAISLIEEHHVQPLRRINSLLLAINYPDKFYHKILAPDPKPSFSRVVTWTDTANPTERKVVGGIVCRLDQTPAPDFSPATPTYVPRTYDIYVQSLALLSPYRGKSLAAAMLNDVISAAASTSIQIFGLQINELYAHVWTENTEGLEWYSRNGFKRDDEIIAGYYRRLKPDSAWVLRRKILPSDHLQAQATLQQTANGTNAPPLNPAPKSPLPSMRNAGQKEDLPPRPVMAGTRSYQDRGPESEWNDLPEDILKNNLLKPASALVSATGSAASSRSSSRSNTAGKKKRAYPAAAFGS